MCERNMNNSQSNRRIYVLNVKQTDLLLSEQTMLIHSN